MYHIFAWCVRSSVARLPALGLWPSDAFAVAHIPASEDVDPFAEMAGKGVLARAVHTPLRIEPQFGKRREDHIESATANEAGNVFEEDVRRFGFGDDTDDVVPDPSLVGRSLSASGNRPGLTGEPCHNAIHCSTPRAAVEGGKVSPHRRVVKRSVFKTRRQDLSNRKVDLHIADCASVFDSETESEVVPANTGAEG